MSKLPLVARKNIKDNEERVEEIKEKITAAVELPTEITFNFDYETTSPAIDKAGYQNRVGDVMLWWLQGLVEGITRQCSSPIAKAALQSAWTTGVIRFQLATNKKGENKYAAVDIENGDMVVSMYNPTSSSNANSAFVEMIENLNDSDSNLRVKAAQNLKDNEEKLAETLQKLQEYFSFSNDVTLNMDYVTFSGKCDTDGYKNRVGEVVNWYIGPLASNLIRSFKHEIAKAALQAVWTSGVVRFDYATNKKNESFYVKSSIQDNDLVLTYYKSGNTDSTGNDLLEQIEDPASHLPLKSALNVEDEKEKREETLEKIHESTGISADVTLDLDWVAFDAFCAKEGYKFRSGDVMGWYLNPLQSNVTTLCKSDISKAALQAVWTTGVIRFEFQAPKAKNENRYVTSAVRDGDLVVTIVRNGNTDSTGRDLLEQLQDPELGLPLKSSLNIKQNEEERQEVLEKIQEITGSGTEVTLSPDWTTFDPIVTKNGYANRVGDVMQWIIGPLKSNLERMCREELTKEAIGEAWTTGVIRFEENKKLDYWGTEFINGDLVIQYKSPERFGTNADSVGRDIESKL